MSFSELQKELKSLNEIRLRTVNADYKSSQAFSSPSLTEISRNMEKVYPIFTPKSKQNNENIDEDEDKFESNPTIPQMSTRCYKFDPKSVPIVAKNLSEPSRKFEEICKLLKHYLISFISKYFYLKFS